MNFRNLSKKYDTSHRTEPTTKCSTQHYALLTMKRGGVCVFVVAWVWVCVSVFVVSVRVVTIPNHGYLRRMLIEDVAMLSLSSPRSHRNLR